MNTRVCTFRPMKYSVIKSFKLTPEQAAKLAAKLNGRSLSDTVRAILDEAEIPPPTKRLRRVVYLDPGVKAILAGIGNNLNQLTHKVHTVALRDERTASHRCLRRRCRGLQCDRIFPAITAPWPALRDCSRRWAGLGS